MFCSQDACVFWGIFLGSPNFPSWTTLLIYPSIHTRFSLISFLQTQYTRLTVLIICEGGKPEDTEKKHCVIRENNTFQNKLGLHIIWQEPGL